MAKRLNWDRVRRDDRLRWEGSLPPPERKAPEYPVCGSYTVKRFSAQGPFWGCSEFPRCRGIVTVAAMGLQSEEDESGGEQ